MSKPINLLIADWPEEVLACRARGHHWLPHTAEPIRGGFEVTEVCAVCGSFRDQKLDNRGRREAAKIRYAEGYGSDPGHGPWTADDRAAVRLAVVKMMIGAKR